MSTVKYTDKPRPKVFLPVPAYDWKVHVHQQASLIQAMSGCHAKITPSWNCNDGIARSRNNLAWEFLQTDNEYLFFVDSDIVFEPVDIDRIVSHGLPIVCGIYPKKQAKLAWVYNTINGEQVDEKTNLLKVDEAGTGFMCIRRDALLAIMAKYPERKYINDPHKGCERFDFFPMHAKGGRYLSEDWYFCEMVKGAGFDIYVDISVQLKHVGSILYPLQATLTDSDLVNIISEKYGIDKYEVEKLLLAAPVPALFNVGKEECYLWPESFIKRGLSPTHCADVLAGSYDVPLEINMPIILDIGANVGAFSKWAAKRWPGARIHCFEPSKFNFSMLLETAKEVGGMNCFNSGVIGGAEYKKMLLKNGANNCGECSIYDLGEQKNYGENCEFIPASALISCDILKLDTEGCEYDILFTLHSVGKLDMAAIVLEWHRAEDRESIMRLLSDSYSITTDRKHSENRGELCFVRKDLLP